MAIAFPTTFASQSGNLAASTLDANFTYTGTLPSQATTISSVSYTLTGSETILINSGATPYGCTLTQVLTQLGSGAATTAQRLATPRTITATGGLSWTVSFDGSANVSGAATVNTSVFAAGGFFRNLQGVQLTAGLTTSTWTADALLLEDGSGNTIRAGALSSTLSLSSTGANALDTGTVAANTWYYVWGIYNSGSSTVATLASLSNTSPTLPTGYTYRNIVGVVLTNGSSQVYQFIQKGRSWEYYLVTSNSVSNGTTQIQGTSTGASNVYFVPYAIVSRVRGSLAGGGIAGGAATVGPSSSQIMATLNKASGGSMTIQWEFNLWNTSIYYGAYNSNCYLYGFELNI